MKAQLLLSRTDFTTDLHDGHKYLLDEIRSKHNKVVVLGISPVAASSGSFDFYTRKES